jgi:hypothetical protein
VTEFHSDSQANRYSANLALSVTSWETGVLDLSAEVVGTKAGSFSEAVSSSLQGRRSAGLFSYVSLRASYVSESIAFTELSTSSQFEARTAQVTGSWVIGIGIGLGVLVLLILGGLFLVFCRRLRPSYETYETTNEEVEVPADLPDHWRGTLTMASNENILASESLVADVPFPASHEPEESM